MIIRSPRPTSNFYLLDKRISEDKRLSWSARGMLIYLLGKPDNWTVSPTALINETKECKRGTGRDGVYATLKELKDTGYLHTVGLRQDAGTFAGADYLVTESPCTAQPYPANPPHTEIPDTADLPYPAQPYPANPTQVSTEGKQGLKKKQGLKGASATDAFTLPDWINASHWNAWRSHPKLAKATSAQKTIAIEKLAKWREAGEDFAGALENAAASGYQGLFLPDSKKNNRFVSPNKQEALEARNKAIGEAWATDMEAKTGANCETV